MYPFERKIAVRRRFIRMRLRTGIATADDFANRLGVSVRTIYRDIDALRRDGVRILGEAGMGYELRRSSP